MGCGGATSQQPELFNDYDGFVEKFKPKKTTDDCYTPPLVYGAVRDWACAEYGIDAGSIVRPFYPGGDYEHFDYPEGCTVLDNPPFSILSKIVRFYQGRGIPFFLFAPALTTFGYVATPGVCAICCDGRVVYENGANVRTSFVTNLEPDTAARTAPALSAAVDEAVARTEAAKKMAELPKYAYPDAVLTAALMAKYSHWGIEMEVPRSECAHIRKLDKQGDRTIFGSGLLLSERLAAERATAERLAAERAARKEAIVWKLSEREKALQKMLGRTA